MSKPLDHIPEEKRESADRMQWDIALLKSRYESEQRQRAEQGKLLSAARQMIEMQQAEIQRLGKEVENCTKMLLNTGSGLMFRMRDQESRQSEGKDNLTRWLAVGGLLIALGSLISRFITI